MHFLTESDKGMVSKDLKDSQSMLWPSFKESIFFASYSTILVSSIIYSSFHSRSEITFKSCSCPNWASIDSILTDLSSRTLSTLAEISISLIFASSNFYVSFSFKIKGNFFYRISSNSNWVILVESFFYYTFFASDSIKSSFSQPSKSYFP